MNLGEDISDAFLAIVNGQTDDLSEVLTRRGDNTSASAADLAGYKEAGQGVGGILQDVAGIAGGSQSAANASRGAAMVSTATALGSSAKGYVMTATGPNYYDCSGLVWRTVQKLGYKGSRFTTRDIQSRQGFVKVTTPAVGDIVLWPGHHMGIMTGQDRMYSARNPRKGIGTTTISGFRKERPIYIRYVGGTPKKPEQRIGIDR
jgi:cell wall-associated NlpC family hydrolase